MARSESHGSPEVRRILLVDDEAAVLQALATVLRKAGYQVIAAESGEAAVAFAREFSFDLAVCDRHLPGMDGIDLLQKLRDLQPMCPRVLLTGGLDLSTTVSAVNRGAITCVLEKPVRSDALRNTVTEALEARDRMMKAYDDLQRANFAGERKILETMLGGQELQLALQPIVNASDRKVVAYEALLRSTHPVLDGPGPVLGAVERHEMVGRLADVVVDRAARMLARSTDDTELFINLHPAELAEPEAMTRRLEQLAPWSDRVVFEITERSSLYGVSAWTRSIDVIYDFGFRIAVDDLGAGYSALSVLAELKPSYMKVDMSIVRDVDRLPHKQRLVDLLCRFAEATESRLVAEGIETEAEARVLGACGAHLFQGYLFGRPRLPARLELLEPEKTEAASDDDVDSAAG